jgi:16S rRNA (cytosine967-C5)-methyltransferase
MSRSFRKTARFVAIETLCRLQQRPQAVSRLFDQLAAESALIASDRHLAMNLIFGVLRQRQYLDNCLSLFSRHPIKKFHPFIHQSLAVGLYQLLFLDRIPASAAVNETVNAIKMARLPERLQGLVNGILRTCIRQRHLVPTPEALDREGKKVLNHPAWLTERWQSHFGKEEMNRICICNNVQPQLVIRVNTSAVDRESLRTLLEGEGITVRPGAHSPQSVTLPGYHGPVNLLPGFKQGFFQVQDESAQLVSPLLAPFVPGGRILDACAGLGGKTSHILELAAHQNITVIAVEPDPQRIAQLKENLTRLHLLKNVEIHPCSLLDFSRNCKLLFDAILIDAPCSGTGVIRRHPDIRWNRSASDLSGYQKTQRQLLDLASPMLLPGGILVYATCSLEPEENSMVVNGFLAEHPDFQLSDCAPLLPDQAKTLACDSFFQPHPTESTDGFFAARLVRSSGNDEDFLCAGERPVVHF